MIFNYIVRNKINGKRYVGAHEGAFDDSYMGSGNLIIQAIKKYGKENFQRDVLNVVTTKKEAYKNEKFLIDMYKTLTPVGYNLSETGGAYLGINEGCSEETRKKLSGKNNFMYGRIGGKHPNSKPILQYNKNGDFLKKWACAMDVTRDVGINNGIIGRCINGLSKTAGGYIWKPEDKTKKEKDIDKEINEAVKGAKRRGCRLNRLILQYSKNGDFIKEWENTNEIMEEMGISGPSIGDCARYNQKTAGGYIWMYRGLKETRRIIHRRVEKRIKENEEETRTWREHLNGKIPWNKGLTRDTDERLMNLSKHNGNSKIVIQYSLSGDYIKEWESAAEANRGIGVAKMSISNCANKKRQTGGGFIWKFKETENK